MKTRVSFYDALMVFLAGAYVYATYWLTHLSWIGVSIGVASAINMWVIFALIVTVYALVLRPALKKELENRNTVPTNS